MDYVGETIDAEPSVDIALDAAQFQAAAYDDDAEGDGQREGAVAAVPATPASSVPEGVLNFLQSLNAAIRNHEISQIFHLYENIFNRLTERFFKNYPWPQPEVAQQLVGGDQVFNCLYKELYYRHIYARLQPTLEQRFGSWQNYTDLFSALLSSEGVSFELPDAWLWDILDEYIYQFQAFCQYKHKIKAKTQEEMDRISGSPDVWSAATLLRTLYALVDKSNIRTFLEREKAGTLESDPVSIPEPVNMYKMLGYFSLVGLVRVHSLLGDYHSALQSLGSIDISRKGLFAKVPACHVSLFYYVGFALVMTRRYVDAIRTFSNILLYISRTERYHARSYQYDQMMKKNDQMYALLGIALSLCPMRVDEALHTTLRDKYQDKLYRMQRGDVAAYEELFQFACPKFVVPSAPDYGADSAGAGADALRLQLRLFRQEVEQQALIPTMRSFLRLYTTIGVKKMAGFIDLDEGAFRANLLCYKHKTAQWVGDGTGKGRQGFFSDVDFSVDNDMIHIMDTKTQRRYSDFFTQAIADLNRGQ